MIDQSLNKKQKSIKLNFIMNAILTMSSFIFPLITYPYVARILLPAGMGKISFATSVITYFSMIAQLGIPMYGIRACAKVRDDKQELSKIVHEIFLINVVMTIIIYVFFFITLSLVPRFQEDKLLMIMLSSTIIFNTIGMEWLYKALENYTLITFRSIMFKFISVVLIFVFIKQQADVVIYGIITVFANASYQTLTLFQIHNFIELKPMKNYDFKRHYKAIAVFFAMSCATTIYVNLDTVMLGFMTSDIDVGYYSSAIKIKMVLGSIVTSLGAVLLPRASYYIEHGLKDEFYKITQKAINFVFVLALPLVVYFILFAKEGILFLSGNQYLPAILPMKILMPTLFFIGLTDIMGIQMLVPLGKEKLVLYSVMIGAIFDLAINALLIPSMASVGAAIGTLAAEIIVWIVQYVALRNVVKTAYKKIKFIPIAVGLIVGSFSSFWVASIGLSAFITLVISAILFFGTYGIVLVLLEEPMSLEILSQITKINKNNGL